MNNNRHHRLQDLGWCLIFIIFQAGGCVRIQQQFGDRDIAPLDCIVKRRIPSIVWYSDTRAYVKQIEAITESEQQTDHLISATPRSPDAHSSSKSAAGC